MLFRLRSHCSKSGCFLTNAARLISTEGLNALWSLKLSSTLLDVRDTSDIDDVISARYSSCSSCCLLYCKQARRWAGGAPSRARKRPRVASADVASLRREQDARRPCGAERSKAGKARTKFLADARLRPSWEVRVSRLVCQSLP